MTLLSVNLPSGEVVSTCPAAVGFSFAAGTTDRPRGFDLTQGDSQGNLFWRLLGGALHKPTTDQINCDKPKPILIDTGEMSTPYAVCSRAMCQCLHLTPMSTPFAIYACCVSTRPLHIC